MLLGIKGNQAGSFAMLEILAELFIRGKDVGGIGIPPL